MGLTENKRIQHIVNTSAAIAADDFDGRLAYDTTEQAIRIKAGGVAKYASMRGHTHPEYMLAPGTSFQGRRDFAAATGAGIVLWRRQRGDASWSTVNGDIRSMFEVPQADTLFPANALRVGDRLVWESEFVRLAQTDILGISVGAAGFGTINSIGTMSVSPSHVCRLRIEGRIAATGASGVIQTAGWIEIEATMHRVQTSNVESGQVINTTINNYMDIVVDPSGAQNYGGYMGSLTYFPAL